MSGLNDLPPASFGLGIGSLGTLQPATRVQMQDDNSGVATIAVLSYGQPTPRTHPFALLRTGHLNMWGSSDFGAGAGGSNAIGFDANHPEPWSIVTGTTATGHVGMTSGGGVGYIVVSATTHRRMFDAVWMIPTLSTVLQQFRIRFGWANASFGAAPTNMIAFDLDSFVNPNLQFITRAGGVATTTDTGVAVAAGTWYRTRFNIDGAGPANGWAVVENTPLGAPTVSNATNIINGTGQGVSPSMLIEKVVGLTDRQLAILYTLTGMDRYAA